MALPTEKGIESPQNTEIERHSRFYKWLLNLHRNFPKVRTFSATLTPANVGAGSESVQTFTVEGLTTSDVVIANKPTNQAGLDLVSAWASNADELSLKYRNHSGGGIVPTAETYRIVSIRL